jgi:hypothetical protein
MLPLDSLSPLSPFLTILPPPLSIFPLIAPISVIITLFFLSFFSLCSIFSSIIFILFIQSAFSACPFSSLPLISSLTVANSFLSSPFSSLTAANSFLSALISSLISLIMVVFISLSISLLWFSFSLLFGDLLVLELFLSGFLPSFDVLLSSLSLLLLSFLTSDDFGMSSLFCSPFFSLTAASSFLRTLLSSTIPAISSLISLSTVSIFFSISLLWFPCLLLLGDLSVLELFLTGFRPSSDILPSSLSLLLSAISACPLFLARCLLLTTSHSLVVVYVYSKLKCKIVFNSKYNWCFFSTVS